jgi:high-affinity K+ transport system ATPase subunit B
LVFGAVARCDSRYLDAVAARLRAKPRYGLRATAEGELSQARWVRFSAQTRMSGVDLRWDNEAVCFVRKGAASR